MRPLVPGPCRRARVAERRIPVGYENNGGSVAADPTSSRVVVTGGGRVRLVSLDGGPTRELKGFSSETSIHGLAFGDGGRLVAAAAGPPARVRVWNLETDAVQDSLAPAVVLSKAWVESMIPGSSDGTSSWSARITGCGRRARRIPVCSAST